MCVMESGQPHIQRITSLASLPVGRRTSTLRTVPERVNSRVRVGYSFERPRIAVFADSATTESLSDKPVAVFTDECRR